MGNRTSRDKGVARLARLYARLGRKVPTLAPFLAWSTQPSVRLVRLPLGVVLIIGGIFSFLPILGAWMLPLGLMLMAIDVPPLQTPVAAVIIRGQRRWELYRRRQRDRRAAVKGTAPAP